MPEVFVGCGSNIDAGRNLRWALRELERNFGALRCSRVYQSPAFGFEGPDFLNLVVGFETEADADSVEAVLSDLENARGRDDGDRSGSRTLDLDLLLQGDRVDAARRLPRDDILRYPFVLGPLAELSPALIHPVTGVAIGDAWKECAKGAVALTGVGTLDAATNRYCDHRRRRGFDR
jgi:2-amino-4-hydroxy-6-hydroxymethyldihydropteridine diphosphokinase